MSTQLALFLFDIDGTLLKGSTAVHRAAFADAFHAVYNAPISLDGVVAAGRTDYWLLMEPLRRHGFSDDEIHKGMPEAFERMQRYVEERDGDLTQNVLPGVREVLSQLDGRGALLGLLTGNLSRIAMAKMRQAGLARYFDVGGFGEESDVRADLVPVALAKASEKAGHEIQARHAVVIGDTPLDIEAGKQGGTRTVGVATGPHFVEDLRTAGADLVLEDLTGPGTVEALLGLVG